MLLIAFRLISGNRLYRAVENAHFLLYTLWSLASGVPEMCTYERFSASSAIERFDRFKRVDQDSFLCFLKYQSKQ